MQTGRRSPTGWPPMWRRPPTPPSGLSTAPHWAAHIGSQLALLADTAASSPTRSPPWNWRPPPPPRRSRPPGLNHMPSGRSTALGTAHNLARWTARIGLGEQIAIHKEFFGDGSSPWPDGSPARARRLTLDLPQRWPWETQFSRALARLRGIPLPA